MPRCSLFLLLLIFPAVLQAQPVKEHGQLKVTGTQLVDEYNNPLVLRGMSFGWHNFWPRFYNEEAVKWLAKDWECTVVRAAMGVEPDKGYIKEPEDSKQKIEAVIKGAIQAGIYVIVDFHSHNIRLNEAKTFFKEMATRYGKYPNVIYELFNEPDYESWQEVKAYSTELIATIRAIDPDNIILVGSPHWDQDIHLPAADPIRPATNIMYTVHFYAAMHKQGLRDRCDSALQKGIPIFISESAGMEATGNGAINDEEWKRWMDWAEGHKISWVTWSVSDKDETCSVLNKSALSTGHWKDTDLKESGLKTRSFLHQYNTNDTLLATGLFPYGRTAFTNEGSLELISSASHFGFSFEGPACSLFVSLPDWLDHNYLQYEIDGGYQKRIRVSQNFQEPITITTGKGGKHKVWIYKATEARTGAVFIRKIAAKNIHPVIPASLPLIEFIGNSITCGAAADPSEVPCGTGVYHDQHNAYMAYGPRVARALKANFMLSSVSGIGVYRNWNSDGPTMPQVYEKTDFQEESKRFWNFSKYNPKIVSIALGTNDFSNGDGIKKRLPFDSAAFTDHYISFVRLVKTKYPQAQIVLLSSPMTGGKQRELLHNCLGAVKAKVDEAYATSKPVALYFFKPMQARGCLGHPDVEDHAKLAAELIPFFRKLFK